MATHFLDDSAPHAFWDRALPPRVEIDPGDTVVFKTREGTGQVTPDSASGQLARLVPELRFRTADEPNYMVSALLPLSIFVR